MSRLSDVRNRLAQRYAQTLNLPQLQSLARSSVDLSGLFLPGVTQAYLAASVKVMLVGKETRGWGKLHALNSRFSSATEYIDHAMQKHETMLSAPPAASKFFQFYHDVCASVPGACSQAPDAVAWSNLFCISYRSGSPTRLAHGFDDIKAMSRSLLHVQIDVLQPDVLLFVTGTGYDCYIKEFFAITDSKRVVPRALWSFKANDVQAYRTSHPQWERGRQYREQALQTALGGQAKESSHPAVAIG